MEIIVWDLGRPGKARAARILDRLRERQCDLFVLAKCPQRCLPLIVENLEGLGYSVLLGGGSFQPSLVVAATAKIQGAEHPAPTNYEHRWIPFQVETGKRQAVQALAVHIPYAAESEGLEGKQRYWDAVIDWSEAHREEPAMILGVFNTGLSADTQGERFKLGAYIQQLLDRGWVDCWRAVNPGETDFGWFSHTGNGFRLDHCFFSPSLAGALESCEFDHGVRIDGLASSAALTVSLKS